MPSKPPPEYLGGGLPDILLCDSAGRPLPMQRTLEIATPAGSCPVVTVQFAVDGERVQLQLDQQVVR